MADTYTGVAKTLHWLIAVLAFALLAIGKLFDVDAEEGGLFGIHTALGLAVLALMVARVAWRLTHAVPATPPGTPGWQRTVATMVHRAFYVLLVALPLSGWALTSVEGDAVSFFGLFPVPGLPVGGGEVAEDFLEETHEILGNVLMGLAWLHVLAGLKHHFFDRDDVLRRMLPG